MREEGCLAVYRVHQFCSTVGHASRLEGAERGMG
jgi:hypothetical protein